VPEGRWANIPMHHPFVDIASLQNVNNDLQACLLAIVTHQPGTVNRTTPYGEAPVCNATLRSKLTTVRTSFWRALGDRMGSYTVGQEVALYQVIVKKIGEDKWEIRGTESSRIEACPPDLVEELRRDTNLQEAPTQQLTRNEHIDYNTVVLHCPALSHRRAHVSLCRASRMGCPEGPVCGGFSAWERPGTGSTVVLPVLPRWSRTPSLLGGSALAQPMGERLV